MKSLGRIFLFVSFIPVFLIFLLTTSIRFQVLNEKFWINTLEKGVAYDSTIKILLPELKKPGSDIDPNLIKLILTKDNLQEFTERNIHLILLFVNGRDEELKIFVPVSKLPRGILPPRLKLDGDELTISQANSFMGGRLPVENIKLFSQVGIYSTIVWVLITGILILILFLMYKLTDKDKRLVLNGTALIIVSLIILAFSILFTIFTNNTPPDVATTKEPATKLIWIVGPPVFQRIVRLWMYISTGGLILGIISFFVKKPNA